MILTAYFDESGTHAGSEVVAVAGYLSTPPRWISFEAQWREALAEYGIGLFHMSDFAVRAPPFNTWTEERRRACFMRLVEIINRNVEYSVGTTISTGMFDEVFPPKAKEWCGGPYGLVARSIFMTVGEIVREHYPDHWIRYVFESGAAGAGQVLKGFLDNYRSPEQQNHLRLCGLSFEDKRCFLPLQAADILAYELYLDLPRQVGAVARPIRSFHLGPLAAVPHDWGYLNRDWLTEFAEIVSMRIAQDALGL
jgi:hypothetical protein